MPSLKAGGGYRLPRHIDARLTAALRTLKNADATLRLAVFLARFHSAPGKLGRAFPVDRIGLILSSSGWVCGRTVGVTT
jgi:hypothetical protein